mmetsp:Transcript_18062/g.49884  ORF Transcript_18062/g.49884 Transcript_18062/m.49884 type:complete len:114 (-) Transcript_18062:417-758(-)
MGSSAGARTSFSRAMEHVAGDGFASESGIASICTAVCPGPWHDSLQVVGVLCFSAPPQLSSALVDIPRQLGPGNQISVVELYIPCCAAPYLQGGVTAMSTAMSTAMCFVLVCS